MGIKEDEGRRPPLPSTAAAVALVTRFALRRWLNRWRAGAWLPAQPRGSVAAGGARRTSPAKPSTRRTALVVSGSLLFALQVAIQTGAVASRLRRDDETVIGKAAGDCLRWADDHRAFERPAREQRDDHLRVCFEHDLRSRGVSFDANRVSRALERYDAHGRGAFREVPVLFAMWPDVGGWPGTERASRVFRALVALVLFGIALTSVGSVEARQIEDELSWLYQLPVKASALLGAKAIVHCFVQPAAWIVGAPMFFALSRMHGWGAAAYGFGVWGALQIGAFAGTVEIVTPLALGRVLGPSKVRSIQAVLGFLGTGCLSGALLLGHQVPRALEHCPDWFAVLPGVCLLSILDAPPARMGATIAGMAYVVLLPTVAALTGGRLVARGLVVSPGQASSRGRDPSVHGTFALHRDGPARRSRGIAGKEMLWITRDRRGLMMVFLTPFLLVLLPLVLRPELVKNLLSSVRRATATGFGLASYGFLVSATSVVLSEGEALWLLYSFPRPVHRMLLDKVTLWCCVGLGYLAMVSLAGVVRTHSLDEAPLDLAVAAGGVVTFAFIAAGLGALATDPFAAPRRGLGVGTAYLYMSFAGIFGYVLTGDSLYAKIVSLAFFSLLALALWQKARNRIPYLLDPTASSPPSLDVSDAIVIVVAFFLAQLLVGLALLPTGLERMGRVSLSFSVAGAAVVAFALSILRRAGVPHLFRTIGIRRVGSSRRLALALMSTPVIGVALGGAALAYARTVARISPAIQVRDAIVEAHAVGDARWLVALAVVSAPVFEEIIFRGFLYRSLRRSWPVWAAALASAATFAVCHPPLAIAPVFVLGLLAAGLIEWSGSTLAPMLLHVTYNAVILSGVWERLWRG